MRMNPIKALVDAGFKSEYAYWGGFISIGLSFASWGLSQAKDSNDKAQSDRWGSFVGHWAPAFLRARGRPNAGGVIPPRSESAIRGLRADLPARRAVYGPPSQWS